MKKPVTEERRFCDFCEDEEGAYSECLVCGKDTCRKHSITLTVYLDRQDHAFRASLCPEHAQALQPLLRGLTAAQGTWESVGHNPEFNEAQMAKILDWLEQPATAIVRSG